MPPIVPGLTELPPPAAPSGPAALLAALAGGQRSGPRTASADYRAGVASLRKAAALDPRLAERIQEALAVLEGTDVTGASAAARPSRDRIGPMAGDIQTPV